MSANSQLNVVRKDESLPTLKHQDINGLGPPPGFPVLVAEEFGAGNETRTRDIHVGNVVLYQLSYSRLKFLGLAQY